MSCTQIEHLNADTLREAPGSAEKFLSSLSGPVRIKFDGRGPGRSRVLVTLLHGNEPSGLNAILQMAGLGVVPVVDVYVYIIAIEAALLKPVFSNRQVPGKRDYNRCFHEPYDCDGQGLVCKQLLDEIKSINPEVVVDMHNTSGGGPSFGVATCYDEKHKDIVALFTDRLIITSLRLGALMEKNSEEIPIVTIECGGSFEPAADQIALDGLQRYFNVNEIFVEDDVTRPIELYFNPMRIELYQADSLVYGNEYIPGSDITLKSEIEHHNFGLVTPQTLLGWVNGSAMERLGAFDAERNNHFKDLYREEDGKLYPKFSQKMFMITSNPEIARTDCLWYVTPANAVPPVVD